MPPNRTSLLLPWRERVALSCVFPFLSDDTNNRRRTELFRVRFPPPQSLGSVRHKSRRASSGASASVGLRIAFPQPSIRRRGRYGRESRACSGTVGGPL